MRNVILVLLERSCVKWMYKQNIPGDEYLAFGWQRSIRLKLTVVIILSLINSLIAFLTLTLKSGLIKMSVTISEELSAGIC